MYASAWILVIAPMDVSFSTSEPRPRTTSSPIVTRSRTHDWSPRMTRAPICEPAKTIAPLETIVPSPISAGGRGSRFVVERGESVGCLPTTAFSSTLTPSPRIVPGYTVAVGWTSADIQRRREHVERTHDAGAVGRHFLAIALPGDEPQELDALELERLVARDPRAEDVARPRLPLAVAVGRTPRRLLVDGDLALELHVVEDDHLLGSDHGDLSHLVRVEPGEVHVGDLSGREAEVTEHDVLHPAREEVPTEGIGLLGILVEEVEDHREVVDTERPEGVLVRADDPEVLPVPVDAEHVAELAGRDHVLDASDARVVEEQVTGHENAVPVAGECHELVHLVPLHCGRLLDEDMLAGLECQPRELVVCRHGSRDDHGIEPGVLEHLVEGARERRLRVARRDVASLGLGVAEPRELREPGEVAG